MSTASPPLQPPAGPALAPPAATTLAGARERFDSLDSLRGVAALGVAYGHFWGPHILDKTRYFSFYLLVDLFFILSGFVLAHRYLDDWLARRITLGQFAGQRFARLYPLHLYGLLSILVFSLVRSALYAPPELSFINALKSGIDLYPDGRAYTFVLHLFLAQNIGLTPLGLSWNGPSWSISVEFFAPLLLLLFIGFFRPGTGAGRNAGFVAPTLVLALVCIMTVVNSRQNLDVHFQNVLPWANLGLIRCIGEMAIGMLAYRTFRALRPKLVMGRGVATLIEAVLLLLASTLLFRRDFQSPDDVLIVPLFTLLICVMATERGWIAQALLLAPFRWAGRLSYSIYLNHYVVVLSLSLIISTQWWLYSFFAQQKWPYFAVVLGLSWLTYAYIENPARRAINARLAGTYARST